MDPNEVWQRNKRWILGIAAGLVLFWIATAVVRSVWDGAAAEQQVYKLRAGVSSQEFYDVETRKAAKAAGDELEAERLRLCREMVFVPDERFVLEGKGDPDGYFDQAARLVLRTLVDKAQQFAVELSGEDLEWSPPVGREEIERTLVGLNVLEVAVNRLLDASEEVRAADAEAIGLQGIDAFEVEAKSSATGRRRFVRRGTDRRRTGASPAVDIEDRVDEHEVSFKFRADARTVQLFLEKCRSLEPPVLLRDGFKAKAGRGAGDPLVVQGRLVGLMVRDA